MTVKTVAASTLAHKQHGAPIGIDGIPQSLPRSKSRLVQAPWTVCSQISQQTVDNDIAKVTVTIGGQAGATALGPDDAVVVSSPGSHLSYLLWHGQRLQIGSSEQNSSDISTALDLGGAQPLTVGNGLLNALPQGTSLVTPTIPGAGQPGLTIGDTRTLVGQLIDIIDNHSSVVVLNDGVAPVTPLVAKLLATLPLDAGKPVNPVSVTTERGARVEQAVVIRFGCAQAVRRPTQRHSAHRRHGPARRAASASSTAPTRRSLSPSRQVRLRRTSPP